MDQYEPVELVAPEKVRVVETTKWKRSGAYAFVVVVVLGVIAVTYVLHTVQAQPSHEVKQDHLISTYEPVQASVLPDFLEPLEPSDPDYKELNKTCTDQTTLGSWVGPGLGGIKTCTPIKFTASVPVYSLMNPGATGVCDDGQSSWFSFDVSMSVQQYMKNTAICDRWPGGGRDVKTQLGTCGVDKGMTGIVGQGYSVECSIPKSGQTPSPTFLQLIGGPWCSKCTSCKVTDRAAIADSSCHGAYMSS